MNAEDERYQGYVDGSDLLSPIPSDNRSASYRHGFVCARADRAGEAAFGSVDAARAKARQAERDDVER